MQHPGIKIELHATNQHINMFLPDVDLAIRPTLNAPNDLRGAGGSMVFEIFATQGFWDENEGTAFAEMNWLGVSAPLSKPQVGVWMEEALPPKAITFRADSFLVLREMAAMGHGACFLPRCIVQHGSGLVTNSKMDMTLKTNLWIVGHEDMERNSHIKTCARFLANALNARVL